MTDKYVLDGKYPRKVEDLLEWAKLFETTDRIVAEDWIGDVRISTIFMGLDHRFGAGPPLLFETMIFEGDKDYQTRCTTWVQAEAMHVKAVAFARSGARVLEPEP